MFENGKLKPVRAFLRDNGWLSLWFSLRVAAALLMVVLTALLVSQFSSYLSAKARSESEAAAVGLPTSLREGAEYLGPRCQHRSTAVVELALHNLDVVTGVTGANIALCIPPRVLMKLRSSGGDGQPVVAAVRHQLIIRPPFRRLGIVVRVDGTSGNPLQKRISFARLIASEGPYYAIESDEYNPSGGVAAYPAHLFIQGIQLTVYGYPEDFPLDTYALGGDIAISLPSDVRYGASREPNALPFIIEPTVAPALRGFAFSKLSDNDPVAASIFSIEARRSIQSKLFSISLAFVPLLLIGVLVIVARRAKGLSFLIGSAAILLAVLPIRTVLVPSGLTSLTLIDYLLGWEVGILALLTVWSGTSLLIDQGPSGDD